MRTLFQIIVGLGLCMIFLSKNNNLSFASELESPNNIFIYDDEENALEVPQNDSVSLSDSIIYNDFEITKESIENFYKISNEGKEFIIRYEKCHLTSYKDLGGGYTIGYGHHGKDVRKNMTISQSQARKYFDIDIQKTEEYARYLLNKLPYSYRFSQAFFDGFCDLIYNAGVGAVQRSVFYDRLMKCRVKNGEMNRSDFEYAMEAIKTLNAPYKGHKIRRQECYDNIMKK